MNLRISFARFLLRLSSFLRSLPVVVMRPSDMAEFSRQAYERGSLTWNNLNDPDAGLTKDEQACWELVPFRVGQILVLGGGGGREAIAFARQGFEVTGVDFSEKMLTNAQEATAQRGLSFRGLVGNIAQLDVPADSFDVVWFSMFLYSTVLNRKLRVAMLRRIHNALKEDGVLICSFHWDSHAKDGPKAVFLRKVVAWLTLGNTAYENGDILFGTIEFRHAFSSKEKLQSEFTAGGFIIVQLSIVDQGMRGWAMLRKSTSE